MNTFQQTINAAMTPAVPGDVVMGVSSYKFITKAMTNDSTCFVGGFCRSVPSSKNITGAIGAGAIRGVVVKDMYFTGSSQSMSVPQGIEVSVLENGVIAILNTTESANTMGDSVYVNETTGSVTFSLTDVAGATDTGFKVLQEAPAAGVTFIKK